jgi:DNA topoisomerase IB
MRKKHVCVKGDVVTFDYTAKSGKRRIQSVVDADVAKTVRALKERRGGGYELLAYRDGDRWVDIKSTDINAYLKAQTGEDITAKDFRTWNATVLCAVNLARAGAQGRSTSAKRVVAAAVKEVSYYLGNTPAVCRGSYIDPRIIDRFQAGTVAGEALVPTGEMTATETRISIEAAVIDVLSDEEYRAAAAA